MKGNKNQQETIIPNHKIALIKNASGETFLKNNNAADKIANTFTNISISLISLLVIK